MQNSSKILITICVLALLAAIVGYTTSFKDLFTVSRVPAVATSTATITVVVSTTTQPVVDYTSQVDVTSPKPNTEIKSPLTVAGRLKGGWFFEANAGLALLDANKQPIIVSNLTATTDWMTAEWVTFKGTIGYPAEYKGKSGFVQISNDNPSGMPENDKKFLVPVLFR